MKSLMPMVMVGLVAGVAAFFAGRHFATPEVDADAADDTTSRVEEADALASDRDPTLTGSGAQDSGLTVAAAEDLRAEVRRLEGEVARLEREEAARAAAAEAASEEESDTVAETGPSMRYEFRGLPEGTNDLAFGDAGRAMHEMTPVIVELIESLKSGSPRVELMGRIQRHNGVLIEQAVKAQKLGLSGTGVNGSFTHPALIVNNVHAMLAASPHPLTEAQEERLAEVGDQFVTDEAKRVAAFTEETLGIEKIISELALKDRLYGAIDELATEEQRELLHPEAIRGRLQADLFCAGLVLAGQAVPLTYTDEASLANALTNLAMSQLALGADHAETIRAHAQAWVSRFDNAYLAYKPDTLDRQGMMHLERAMVAADAIVPFYRGLLRDIEVSDSVRTSLAGAAVVPVPMRAR